MVSHNQAAHDRYNSEAHPSKPFGAALGGGKYSGVVERPPIIGRTVKPRAAGACAVCGERRWFCDCDNGESE